MKDKRKILSIILLIIAVICLAGAIFLSLFYHLLDKRTEETLENFRSSASLRLDSMTTNISSVKDNVLENVANYIDASVPNPYSESFLANEDMVGWLTIPGTRIDYPVMWTPEDEKYYLYRNFYKEDDRYGCLILDTDSCLDPLTTNLIIHGHNTKTGTMFAGLSKYTSKEYFNEHKNIVFYTREHQKNYEIIAVFRSQVYKKTDNVFKFYQFFQADTEEEFNDFYNNIKALSLYDTGVTAEFGDNFITLSTCAYHVTNGRFVVVAKEVEKGDVYLPIE